MLLFLFIGSIDTKDAISALILALQDKVKGVRAATAKALRNIGTDAKDAVPALILALQDNVVDVRGSAAEALGSIGEGSEDVVPALIQT